jgi:hypothetical protein
MGVVFRAHDEKLERDVAIKTLTDVVASDQDRLWRFQREGQILASLNHPNIAQIYGLEDYQGTRCIVMELVEGETLQERLRRGRLAIADALQIATQVADALEAAHEKGVVHRDLKPSNIKLMPDGKVKVLDFGLAKSTGPTDSSASGLTTGLEGTSHPGAILGTAAYMSPEQARGLTVDKRTDVWAFGAVLFEMLTGERAFPGSSAADIFAAVIHTEPDWRKLPAGVPAGIVRVLRRCLTKEPQQRLRDIADARLEIRDVLSGSAEISVIAPMTHRNRRAVVIAILLVMVGAIAAGAFMRVGRVWNGAKSGTAGEPPLVIMMDSPNPARVYDSATLAANGTNADVISDVLSDLPIRRQKEAIGPDWHRDEEIRRFHPDLVIIHYSGFYPEGYEGPRDRLKVLIKFFEKTPTQFLIYSRLHEAQLQSELNDLLADLYAADPGLRERVRAFGVLDYGPPQWLNKITSSQLKLAVNVESAKTLVIKIDKSAPVTSSVATPAPNATGWNGSAVTVNLSAIDNVNGSGVQNIQYLLSGAQTSSAVLTANPASVGITAEGITTMNYAAVDAAGNAEPAKPLTLKIDKTGPVISGMPAPGCTLSPPKHQLVQMTIVTASDSLSGLATLTVTASSNEPDSGTGGGDVPGDIVINGGTVLLRAERTPSGSGRIYTIVATAKDLVGNTTTATATCSVPK